MATEPGAGVRVGRLQPERGRPAGARACRWSRWQAGSVAVVPDGGGGRVDPPAPEVAGFARRRLRRGKAPGRPDAGGGPGTPVTWTSPPAGSENAGLTARAMVCAGTVRYPIGRGVTHGRRRDCRRWSACHRQRGRRCRSIPRWRSLHGPDVLVVRQGIERTVPGGQHVHLFRCDSMDEIQGLDGYRVGPRNVARFCGSTGHVLDGAVCLFRLGGAAGTTEAGSLESPP